MMQKGYVVEEIEGNRPELKEPKDIKIKVDLKNIGERGRAIQKKEYLQTSLDNQTNFKNVNENYENKTINNEETRRLT